MRHDTTRIILVHIHICLLVLHVINYACGALYLVPCILYLVGFFCHLGVAASIHPFALQVYFRVMAELFIEKATQRSGRLQWVYGTDIYIVAKCGRFIVY